LRALITEELEQRQAWFQVVTSMIFRFRSSTNETTYYYYTTLLLHYYTTLYIRVVSLTSSRFQELLVKSDCPFRSSATLTDRSRETQ
jgi:hypothetical protein